MLRPIGVILLLGVMIAVPAHAESFFRLAIDGYDFSFPMGQRQIARRLAQETPRIHRFLQRNGLSLAVPIHVVLDPDLDVPGPRVHVIPHREIRLGLKAPGVFEDGWLAPDPWRFFLFKGLCLQAIYQMRSGLPALAHKAFGEIVSPNVILPDWITDGVCHLLYARYDGKPPRTPINDAILRHGVISDLDAVSNHPEHWPGHYSYRIFGRPFIRWIVDRHGWDRLLGFLSEHGRGVIPFEIDWKAKRHLGATWPQLWRQFQKDHGLSGYDPRGEPVHGYWADPYLFWNRGGIFPGVERIGHRSRYGVVDAAGTLWLSQYDENGISKRVRYDGAQPIWEEARHIWDPGPGGVAITRMGHRPYIAVFPGEAKTPKNQTNPLSEPHMDTIAGPEGVISLSGPTMDANGRIAVAGNSHGNWDIWLFDGGWRRLTHGPTTEIDPWFEGDAVLYASDRDGVFQIMDTAGNIRSRCHTPAVMPRDGNYLCLSGNGWVVTALLPPSDLGGDGDPNGNDAADTAPGALPAEPNPARWAADAAPVEPYTPFASILPNYLQPELFISGSDIQLGVGTFGRDVTGDYTVDGGIRYSIDDEFWSLRAGAAVKRIGLRYTRYPFSYGTALHQVVDEWRHEIKAFWRPWKYEDVELSANYRVYEDQEVDEHRDEEHWAALHLADTYGRHSGWLDLEWYSGDRRSVFGGGQLFFGESVFTMLHLQAGKSWGTIRPGHHTYRIGGNVVEGYFTQRPSRLFPLRGFDSNILDAGQAVTAGIEIFWPLINLQAGYVTLPLFFHRMMLGTFIDTGAADDTLRYENFLVGGGVELVTSMEIAWGYLSSFRMGLAWPIHQPDPLEETGPVFLIQLGMPL